ncbi:MAG: amidohydrolase family protein [Gammaproteobacteria bacterium]|nr:amidohydrolase family protein [Gammaproteobacteria bacterium]
MPAGFADLRIDARWTVPMHGRDRVLEDHSLFVRDGRIEALVPRTEADRRPRPPTVVERPNHVLLPGLIDTAARTPLALLRGLHPRPSAVDPTGVDAGVALAIAQMLTAGVTCFADRSAYPDAVAHAAIALGMRAVIGAPIAERTTAPGSSLAADLGAALARHDEYKDHPSITTAFAPAPLGDLTDAALERLKVLADELDTTVVVDWPSSPAEIADSLARHGRRPIERLQRLGLLNRSLRAVHLATLEPAELRAAGESAIAATVCPSAGLRRGAGLPPIAALRAAGLRLALGSDGGASDGDFDLWRELRLCALVASGAAPPLGAWEVLAMATRDAAEALGIDAHVGTLETGKWADLCCVEALGPAVPSAVGLVEQLVFCGGRDIVRDVWIAGRPAIFRSQPTRFDWTQIRERASQAAQRLKAGG